MYVMILKKTFDKIGSLEHELTHIFNDYKIQILGVKRALLHSSVGRVSLLQSIKQWTVFQLMMS